jgi:uncharacterized protein YijF (DUF1287 family)
MARMKQTASLACVALCLLLSGCDGASPTDTAAHRAPAQVGSPLVSALSVNRDWRTATLDFGLRLSAAAEERATKTVVYDAAYVRIPYPGGDVAADRGVCSDEVIRAYRLLGIDLQQLVHEDMRRAFHAYPKRWGLAQPDPNIDHRRVPNLATFMARHGQALAVTHRGSDYRPGDVVAFALADGRPHIGIVTQRLSDDGQRPLVMHNIGYGPQIEDMLFSLKITGRYRYGGPG